MNKGKLGLLLVILGVSIAAVFGARNTMGVNASLAQDGTATIPRAKAKKAFDAYCAALKEASETSPELAEAAAPDACFPEENDTPSSSTETNTAATSAKTEEPPAETYEQVITRLQQAHAKRMAAVTLPKGPLSEKRSTWLKAEAETFAPIAKNQTSPADKLSPTTRLGDWFSLAGLPFLGGLALIVGGGFIARQAQRETILASGADKKGGKGPVDFGELLLQLQQNVESLQAAANADTPSLEALVAEIETIQFEQLEPLVESRGKVQARFGVAGFADIFSPLSGGERNLNRAWSALVDQHLPEARTSIEIAAQQIGEAQTALKKQLAINS